MAATVRPATIDDLPSITEIHNYYVVNTHIVFDVQPFQPEQRVAWFKDHSDGRRYRMLVACDSKGSVQGFACTGRHRTKEAYDTTVEASIACGPSVVGRGIGSL